MTRKRTCPVVLGIHLLDAPMLGAQPVPTSEVWHSEEFFRETTAAGVAACLAAGAHPMAREADSHRTPLHLAHVCQPYQQVLYNQQVPDSEFGVWHYIW